MQITALLLHRHDGPCFTDDASTWFDEVAVHLVLSCRPAAVIFVAQEWARRHAPVLSGAEIAGTLERVRRDPPFYTSADIGRRLNVTAAEKASLGLTHIAAADVSAKAAADAKRARNRERAKADRLAAGCRPQAQSITRQKPWLAANVSRATWYRNAANASPE